MWGHPSVGTRLTHAPEHLAGRKAGVDDARLPGCSRWPFGDHDADAAGAKARAAAIGLPIGRIGGAASMAAFALSASRSACLRAFSAVAATSTGSVSRVGGVARRSFSESNPSPIIWSSNGERGEEPSDRLSSLAGSLMAEAVRARDACSPSYL